MPKLTRKQQRFADEYVVSGNATRAALAAYDTSPAVARSIGSENLTKPAILEELKQSWAILD